MPDDHSELVPPLPIPNRTVKRLHANDSADTRVKVGNRQAPHSPLATKQRSETPPHKGGVFAFPEPRFRHPIRDTREVLRSPIECPI